MIRKLGQEKICDGKFTGTAGANVPCAKVLHPGTHAMPNKVGILGHHCDFCHDPAATLKAAQTLGVTEEALRAKFPSLAAAAKGAADKLAADAAVAAKAAAPAPAAPAPAK